MLEAVGLHHPLHPRCTHAHELAHAAPREPGALCPRGAVPSERQWMFPGCQSPPVKPPAPAFMSSAALCAQYNGSELFVCHGLQGRSTARAAGDNDSRVPGTATPWRHYPTKAVAAGGGMR